MPLFAGLQIHPVLTLKNILQRKVTTPLEKFLQNLVLGKIVEHVLDSFLLIVLLWEREREMVLKKESFFDADKGGDPVNSRPPDKLSMLGDELMIFELWPLPS